jgi:glycolate oxidase iron-sulfur subunit
MRAVEDGKLDLADAGLEEHLYHCLDCRACNTVCPAGIPIGELIVQGRAAVEEKHPRSWIVRFVLNHALISPRRIEWFVWPARFAQRLRLDRLGVVLFGWLPKLGAALRDLVQMAPRLSKPVWGELRKPDRSRGDVSLTRNMDETCQVSTHRVGFFLGCVMNVAFADASRATVKLLKQFGCEVITPNDQMCCGAPQDDQGLKDQARKMAKRNIAAFENLGELDAIVADCAACSGFLKEYTHLLHDDAEWAARADRFARKVRDVTEWLDIIMSDALPLPMRETIAPEAEWSGGAGVRVTYHEPCHLANVQGVRRQPRALLMRLKQQGVDVRDLPDSTRCCGSAGIYNLTHTAMSKDLLDRKMADVASTGAEVVISANPGCLLQLEWGARRTGLTVKVKHVTQVLAEALEQPMSN